MTTRTMMGALGAGIGSLILISQCSVLGADKLVANGDVKNHSTAPLFPDLAKSPIDVTTSVDLARQYFNQGLVLLYAFNHAEAHRSFKAATELDPNLVMGWWGMAFALGPNINAPMDASAIAPAWDALQRGLAVKHRASPREQAYMDALAMRYVPELVEDRSVLDREFGDAMRAVMVSYPDDLDAAVLFCEAAMDTMPWDYWTERKEPRPATVEVLRVLEGVLRRDPDHAGANHLYIHAVEAGPNPEWGLPSADSLVRTAPAAGHLIHMPSHIYVRVGKYEEASEANERAIQVDEALQAMCRAQGFYDGVYYPHNIHFLAFSRMMEGRYAEALAAAKKVEAYALDRRCSVLEGPRMRHLPIMVMAQFGQWEEILQTAEPRSHPFDRVFWRYGRGLAHAAMGAADSASDELKKLRMEARHDDIAKMDGPTLPALALVQIAESVLEGRVLQLRGDGAGSIKALERAVQTEDGLPYMEPPFWFSPVRPMLASAYMELDQPERAETVFREDLNRLPRNGWSLRGLAKSLRRQGKLDAATRVDAEHRRAWASR